MRMQRGCDKGWDVDKRDALHLRTCLMDSIDPECTQLKHVYEACFQKWYTNEYLPMTEEINNQDSSGRDKDGRTSIFKSSTPSVKETTATDSNQQKYKELARSYDSQCGVLFATYRACLEKTLKSRKIDVMLEEHHAGEESNNK